MSSGDGIRTLCGITGAAWDSPCGRMAGPTAGKPSKMNLGCGMTGERMPLQGVLCKDWGQLLTVEWGGKGRSPFWVAPGKKLLVSPYITHSSLTVFEKGIFSADSSLVTDRRTRLRAASEVCLTFKKKDVSWQLAKYRICLSLHLCGWSWTARWWRWANLSINRVRACSLIFCPTAVGDPWPGRTSLKPHLQHLWERPSWEIPAVGWGGTTPPSPHMGWEEGREAPWVLLNIFFLLFFLFFTGVFLLLWWVSVGECW